DRCIIQFCSGCSTNSLGQQTSNRRGVSLSRGDPPSGLIKRAGQCQSVPPLFETQVLVARAEGQAVGLANDRAYLDLDGYIQIADHLLQNTGLLGILLAEVGDVRLHDVEQLEHHRGDAAEVSRPGCTAKDIL